MKIVLLLLIISIVMSMTVSTWGACGRPNRRAPSCAGRRDPLEDMLPSCSAPCLYIYIYIYIYI